MSKEDRERFDRQARDLERIETDDPGTPEQRARMLRLVNALRVADGREPFADDEATEHPELGFFERAQALAMARIRCD